MNKKRSVVHLVYSLGYGGLEQVIVNLINNSQDDNVNHIVITLVDIQDLYQKINANVPIYCLNKKAGNDIGSHFRLFKLLLNLKPDVLNTYNFGTIEYQLTAFICNVKTRVHSEHGRDHDDPDGANRKRNSIRKFVSFFLSKFVVVSPDLYDWAKNIVKVSHNKIQLIYNGVDTDVFTFSEDKFNKFTLCNVGRADPVKNQKLLISSYSHIFNKYPDFQESQLLIIGDGPLFDSLQSEITRAGMTENIRMLGFRDDIDEIMKKSHLFVLSSIYEAMPMVVLEAMSCGLPVVSTDVGGVSNLITKAEGWLVPSQDIESMGQVIYTAFKDAELRNTKAAVARNKVLTNFSIQTMVKQYLHLYDAL